MIFSSMERNSFIKALFFTFLSLECSFLFVILMILTVYMLSSSTLDFFFFFLKEFQWSDLFIFPLDFKYRSQNIQCKWIEMFPQEDFFIPDGGSWVK